MLLSTIRNARVSMRSMSTFSLELPSFKLHNLPAGSMPTHATTTKEEMLGYYRSMFSIRRMEITCDTEYKARNIRGFCHLYDGQEAVGMGVQSGLSAQDPWITSYRCHAAQFLRNGENMSEVFAELFGRYEGCSKGKGGSMHMYTKKGNFYGGQGIVGAQVPLGVGLAFAEKYRAKGKPSNVAITMYGDGAANQGQIWEVANMAALWDLPCIFLIENNHYGMGTSTARHSSNEDYYTMGNKIPGIQANGMNVLAAREAIRFARKWCSEGNGPMYIEMLTYRYHGHSMSDPGITYRDRDEVNKVRETQDCLLLLKSKILEQGIASEDELKIIEKEARQNVAESLKKAKSYGPPDTHETYSDIYFNEIPSFIRGREYNESLGKII